MRQTVPAGKQQSARMPNRSQRAGRGPTMRRWATVIGGGGLATLGLSRRSLPGLAVAAVGGGLAYRAARGGADAPPAPIHVAKSVTVLRPREEVYRYWRNLENLPNFMSHLASVMETGDKRSHWAASAPMDSAISWEAEIVEERPGELLAWRSVEGSTVENRGTVRFSDAPGNRGTEVRVSLDYLPPAGAWGATFARLFGEAPGQQIEDDLRRFKHILEAGEFPTTQGQSSGRREGFASVEARVAAVKQLIEAGRIPGGRLASSSSARKRETT